MADNLTPLPNPGDADYPTNPDLAAAIEAERTKRKKDAEAKKKSGEAWRRPVGVKTKPKPKVETTEKLRTKTEAFDAQAKKRRAESTSREIKKALNNYGQNPTAENKAVYEKLIVDYKRITGKDFVASGKTKPTTTSGIVNPNTVKTPLDTSPLSKGFLASGTDLINKGPAFTQESINAVWGGTAGQRSTTGATGATTTTQTGPSAVTGSGYASFPGGASTTGTVAASPFVTVPIATTTTQGYSTSTYTKPTIGMAHMTNDAALTRFMKSLTSNTPEAQSIVNYMIKTGAATKNTSQQDLYAIYKNALDWTAQAIASGTTNYTVNDALASYGKAVRGAGGGGAPRNTTSVSYNKKIYTEDEVRSIGNAVAQNLLGRMLTDEEIKQHLGEVNTESKKAPQKTVTKTHYAGNKQTQRSVTSGGYDAQAGLEGQLSQTTESQAYTTNNLFNSAMQVLASRIG